ncbi:MAG TPA: glycosyltransferase family 2 protein [Acidimicrobiia bacterium]|nr:glycosyltransferase family 2 protein [Acidimicrobiia bacterium]
MSPETLTGRAMPASGEWPSVSVVIPTRDRPEMLRRAIASILSQDYPGAVEGLVVFDQSPVDATLESSTPGRTVRVLGNARVAGLAGTRNTGILAAAGDLVAFCDDDDEWLPGKLRRQVEILAAEPETGVVVTGVRIAYGGRLVDRVAPATHLPFEAFLQGRVAEAHPSSIVARRAEVTGGIGLVDEEIPGSYGEDHEWLLRASRRAPVAVVPEPLVLVRWNRQSWFSDRWETITRALAYLLEKYPEFSSQPRGLAYIYGRTAFAFAAAGDGPSARRFARKALALKPTDARSYLAVLVSTRLVPAPRLVDLAHRLGRGL